MNTELVRLWNEKVMPDDEVWYLGDFALGRIDETLTILGSLNGAKVNLIPGNHDRCFDPNNKRANEWTERYMNAGFSDIYDAHLRQGGAWPLPDTDFVMAHFPYSGDSGEVERFKEYRPIDEGKVLLHGHTHAKEPVSYSAKNTLQINVGIDAWGYAPVSLDSIRSLIQG